MPLLVEPLTVIRELALRQLHRINSPVDILVEALKVVVAEENPSLWAVFEASRALKEIGPDARPAIPVLALAVRKWDLDLFNMREMQ